MHLTELFDLSLRGRAGLLGLEYSAADGSIAELTFGEIDDRASRMAQELAARGLSKGDRLCLHLENRIEFIDLFLACVRLGVIVVPMNVLYREREARHIISDAAPVAVVAARGSDAVYPDGTAVWYVDESRRHPGHGTQYDRQRISMATIRR